MQRAKVTPANEPLLKQLVFVSFSCIVTGLITGVGGSYVAMPFVIAEFEHKLLTIETNLNNVTAQVNLVTERDYQDKVELAARGQWIKSQNKIVELLQANQAALMDDRYRRSDANADNLKRDMKLKEHIERYHR